MTENICLSVDLPALVREEGYPLRLVGSHLACHKCPSCGESSEISTKLSVYRGSDRWRFRCFSCDKAYGDAADFLALSRNITTVEALKELREGCLTASNPKIFTPYVQNPEEVSKALEKARAVAALCKILRKEARSEEPIPYLLRRGISRDVIDLAIASGQLRMLPMNPEGARAWLLKHVGKALMQDAGLFNGDSRWPALVFHPLLVIEPSGSGFECRVATFQYLGTKAIRYGRFKWPWYLSRAKPAESVLVTEGFIDTMSGWQMLPEVHGFMGIPGTNGWKMSWFEAFHAKSPKTEFLIGFDVDDPGVTASESLIEQLSAAKIPHSLLKPPGGKDWNVALGMSQTFI